MPNSAWDSSVIPCKLCSSCSRYRAARDKETCCNRCAAGSCQESGNCDAADDDGHEADCPRLEQKVLQQSFWEMFRCDLAAEEEAACLVVPPHHVVHSNEGDTSSPSPVILFLTGNGHIDDRQDFFWGGVDQLLRNEKLRHAYILAPKPSSKTGVLRYNDKWRRAWAEDAVWALFTEVLRRLGPEKIDPRRLYATGLSLGAAGVWHLGIRYGQYLAAIVPISGQCEWPAKSWPSKSDPEESVKKRLEALPIRAYHTDVDHYSGNPVKDMQWLCWGLSETSEEKVLRGVEKGRTCEIVLRRWSRQDDGAVWDLFLAKGPLKDWSYYDAWGGDKHCLWQRVYPFPEWGLADFLMEQIKPEGCCWSFDAPPIQVDTSEAKEEQSEETLTAAVGAPDLEALSETKSEDVCKRFRRTEAESSSTHCHS
eukprot:TRINITY_DN49214_c0_g1_i1.p1 TRINITY_DN49214_c0_g1~~TRINITY_DN49214_c0_g1_i1.p1  ORF type:complete len:423 (-),score=84.62 TRINITY_DN49214_c0_g1_i1:231-1499(-)